MSKIRYTVEKSNRGSSADLHFVFDNSFGIEVFHWYGSTGKEKCEAVAKALNDLGHTE